MNVSDLSVNITSMNMVMNMRCACDLCYEDENEDEHNMRKLTVR